MTIFFQFFRHHSFSFFLSTVSSQLHFHAANFAVDMRMCLMGGCVRANESFMNLLFISCFHVKWGLLSTLWGNFFKDVIRLKTVAEVIAFLNQCEPYPFLTWTERVDTFISYLHLNVVHILWIFKIALLSFFFGEVWTYNVLYFDWKLQYEATEGWQNYQTVAQMHHRSSQLLFWQHSDEIHMYLKKKKSHCYCVNHKSWHEICFILMWSLSYSSVTTVQPKSFWMFLEYTEITVI